MTVDASRVANSVTQPPLSPLAKYTKSISWVNKLKLPLLKWVNDSFEDVAKFQKLCGVESAKIQKYAVLHVAFKIGASLGDELFYMIFFPTLFWCYDIVLSRRLIVMWLNIYYVGQAVKDMLELPRPTSPPVVHLEQHYITEYGLPSTHSMAAVSMPAYILFLTRAEHFHMFLPIGVAWFILMTFSRVYLGVHSFPDIYVGLGLGLCILCFHCAFGAMLDDFVIGSAWSPLTVVLFAMFLIAVYPAPEKWTTAFGDTTLVIGVAVGVCFASWTHFFFLELPAHLFNGLNIVTVMARILLGILIVVLVRSVVKKSMLKILKYLVGYENVLDAVRTYSIEIPTKFMTYSSIGFSAVFLMPRVFDYLKI